MYNCESCKKTFINQYGLDRHVKKCDITSEMIDDIIFDYINNNLSIRDLAKKYNIDKSKFLFAIKGITRNPSEAGKLRVKKYKTKHTEKSKAILREKRLLWMKENPEKTAWRKSNLSYPEKLFLDKITELEFDKKYLIIRERCVFPYFIDFAFENQKIAVEIDGSQHVNPDRVISDMKKDKILISSGWKVIRFTEYEIKTNLNNCFQVIENLILSNNNISDVLRVGVFFTKEKKFCNTCGKEITQISDKCNKCANVDRSRSQRKVERPSYESLTIDIEELGFVGTSKKYGVSDNAIRKWIRMYKKHGKDF